MEISVEECTGCSETWMYFEIILHQLCVAARESSYWHIKVKQSA